MSNTTVLLASPFERVAVSATAWLPLSKRGRVTIPSALTQSAFDDAHAIATPSIDVGRDVSDDVTLPWDVLAFLMLSQVSAEAAAFTSLLSVAGIPFTVKSKETVPLAAPLLMVAVK
jgi:hypothetical protein